MNEKTRRVLLWVVPVVGGVGLLGILTVFATGVFLFASKPKTEEVPAVRPGAESPFREQRAREARDRFRAELFAFVDRQESMTPEAQAAEWLRFYDRFWELPPSPDSDDDDDEDYEDEEGPLRRAPLSARSLAAALPPPEAWPIMQRQADAQAAARRKTNAGGVPDAARSLLLHLLNPAPEAYDADVARLKAALPRGKPGRYFAYQVDELGKTLRRSLGPAESAGAAEVARFEQDLEDAKGPDRYGVRVLNLPDLVAAAGPAKAEALLRDALRTPHLLLLPERNAAPAAELARRLIRERAAETKLPQWGLVDAPEHAGLCDLFDAGAKVPKADEDDSDFKSLRQRARFFQLLALLQADRSQDAARFFAAHNWGDGLTDYRYRASLAELDPRLQERLLSIVIRTLEQQPESPLWSDGIRLSQNLGKPDAMRPVLDAAAARLPSLSHAKRLELETRLTDGLLAADRIDEAAARMQALWALSPQHWSGDDRHRLFDLKLQYAGTALKMGRLLGGSGLEAAAVAEFQALQTEAGKLPARRWEKEGATRLDARKRLARQLLDAGRPAEAEPLLRAVLADMDAIRARLEEKRKNVQPSASDEDEASGDDRQDVLLLLARALDKNGRPDDLLRLLATDDGWNFLDLAAIDWRDDEQVGLVVAAARALHAAGRDAESARVLKAVLTQEPGRDDAWGLLTTIGGPELPAWMDGLCRRDRFEERPLIWKAVLLLRAGRVDDAETAVRAALKVDPTDGEEPAGDRCRAYAVLADVLEAKGKAEDAAFFRKAVRAVRIAEEGDELKECGLTRRSLAKYEEGMQLFADAYCIQWRLGQRLAALGRPAEARAHFRLAFERMPEQFGSMAHFCFGCEGAFTSPLSRSVAEQVLMEAEKSGAAKPQVSFLLGQLREAQKRPAEAAAWYRRATELDPDYLDAWNRLAGLTGDVAFSGEEQNRIALRLLELDPLGRYAVPEGLAPRPAELWKTARRNLALSVPPPESLLPMPASTRRLVQERNRAVAKGGEVGPRQTLWRDVPAPGEALLCHPAVRELAGLLESWQERNRD